MGSATTRPLLVQIDKLGNLIWIRYYSGTNHLLNYIKSIAYKYGDGLKIAAIMELETAGRSYIILLDAATGSVLQYSFHLAAKKTLQQGVLLSSRDEILHACI